MEFPEEFIKEQNLSPEQIQAINDNVTSEINKLESEWSSKANKNAEGILNGVAKDIETLTGIEREKGQKYADYLKLASKNFFSGKESALERQREELERKMKNANTDDGIKQELESVKNKLNELKQKEAQFADWEENDYKGKLEETKKELSGLKLKIAFEKNKPIFPKEVNEFEAKFKWDNFIKNIQENYTIHLEEDEAICVDKNNEFKKIKLSELVKKDENISGLLKGSVKGIGSKVKTVKFEGVPFDVPENATSAERTKLIKEYLASINEVVTSSSYAKKFAELNQKILAQKTA